MNDYVPLQSFEGLPSPHTPAPPNRDPWHVWLIAASPVLPLATMMLVGGTSYLGPVVAVVASVLVAVGGSVWLARREEAPNPWLATLPAVYLLVRAPTPGNTLWPLVVNLAVGFFTVWYVALFLAGIVSIVNRS